MDIDKLIELRNGLRDLPTSRLIIMMNADALVDVFRSSPVVMDESDRKQVIESIADEIDRRIPVRP